MSKPPAFFTALLFIAVGSLTAVAAPAKTTPAVPTSGRWVAWTDTPALAWEDAFPTGNGRHGTMPCGAPGSERIICVHEELFLRSYDRKTVAVADIAKLMPEVRRLANEGKVRQAAKLACDEARKQLAAKGAPQEWALMPHPAFDLGIRQTLTGKATGYRRELDMETGVARIAWKDDAGGYEQSVFSSRTADVNVVRLKSSGGRKLDVSLDLSETPGRTGDNVGIDLSGGIVDLQRDAKPGWLTYHARYGHDSGGYEGLARVIPGKGGSMVVENGRLHVTDTDDILILLRITPLADGKATRQNSVKDALAALPADYEALLAAHARKHGDMFRRVSLDMGAAKEWGSVPVRQLLADIRAKGPSPLFYEQMHAMGRYLLISSSGKYPPPLQGIWGGSWKPRWVGGFVLDTNLNLAISNISMGDLPECAESYFGYVERVLPGWRKNARGYMGCRGFLVPHYSDPETGYLCHFNDIYPWMYWPAGAGWNIMPFYEHAMITGDLAFLRKRVLPLYREMADFYEDYLTEGKDGRLHVVPSISPENSRFHVRDGLLS
ncbi:MAG TPA: glycoside hydrolase N-terminal domain-containing protein, partial [Luteolibacter sp.]